MSFREDLYKQFGPVALEGIVDKLLSIISLQDRRIKALEQKAGIISTANVPTKDKFDEDTIENIKKIDKSYLNKNKDKK